MNDLFSEDDIMHAFTRREAIEDGFQVDANIGDLAEVTKQHFTWPVYMTHGVYSLIEMAVENPKHHNDWKGVWHDILTMSKHGEMLNEGTSRFVVIITGTGPKRYHTMIAQAGPVDIDNPNPALTIMLPDED